jgi:hypothetical protein
MESASATSGHPCAPTAGGYVLIAREGAVERAKNMLSDAGLLPQTR